jgi:hypothetical protein
MFFISLFRHYMSSTISNEKKSDLNKIREGQILMRARRLRSNGHRLSPQAFNKRKQFFNGEEGLLTTKSRAPAEQGANSMMNPMMNPMMDPSNMSNMMKRNATMVVSNLLLYSWVDSFFSGFVAVKLPFPLTNGFKDMLQRGIDLTSLDPTYVSSLSWYLLTLFGLRGVNNLVLGQNNAADDTKMMQQQMDPTAGMQMQTESWKFFKAEKENLELVQHQWAVQNTEKRLVQQLA